MDQSLHTLESSRVLVVGAGALGANVAGQLGSSGVGYLGVVDGGTVGLNDLVSQSLHFRPDLGANRADNVAAKLGILNPDVQVDSYPVQIDVDNAAVIVEGHDVVVTCIDDRTARLALNDACIEQDRTLIDVAAGGEHGVLHTVVPSSGACLRCQQLRAFDVAPALAISGLVGSLAAVEAIRALAETARDSTRIEIDAGNDQLERKPIACLQDCRCKAGAERAVGKV